MAAGDIQQRSNSGNIQDIQSLLNIFKGTPATTTTSNTKEDVSTEKANAYIKQILESTGGLAAVSGAQKASGLYNSSTNGLLINDLLARTASQTAALSSNKTTTQRTQGAPQANLGKTILGLLEGQAASTVGKTAYKKLGVDKWGKQLEDTLFGESTNGVGAGAGVMDTGDITNLALTNTGSTDSAAFSLDFLDNMQAGAEGSGDSGRNYNEDGSYSDSAGLSGGEAAAVGIGAGAAAGAAAGEGAAAVGGGYVVGAEGATWGAAAAEGATVAEEGAGIWEAAATAIAAWIICTELNKQGRLPNRYYIHGARAFANYPMEGRSGYYVWAIPSVKHLRKYPNSWYSKLMEYVFNVRAEHLSALAGVRGARKTVLGSVINQGLYALCWVCWKTIARKPIDWTVVNKNTSGA